MWTTKLEPTTHMSGKNAKCNNCQKMGHFARVCLSKQNKNDQRRINYLEETNSEEEEEEESEPEELRQITQINKILPDNNDHYGVEMMINGKKQKFIIDTGPRSPSCQTTRRYTTQKKSNQ